MKVTFIGAGAMGGLFGALVLTVLYKMAVGVKEEVAA